MTKTLFECCTNVVLGSPYLLERVSLHLPRQISYFLLYLSLETRNQLAVRKIIEKWPHPDLSLNFLAESSLCLRHRCNTLRCLEPHEYMQVFGSYARYSCDEVVSSVFEGVFYNLYSYSAITRNRVGLRVFNMSSVVVAVHQVPLLLSLVNGCVPGTHPFDYVSGREAKVLGVTRPHLEIYTPQLTAPLALYINLLLDDTTTKQTIHALTEICSQHRWIMVTLKGINLLGVNSTSLEKFHLVVDTLISPRTEHVYLTETCCRDLKGWQGASGNDLSLWLSREASLPPTPCIIPVNCRDLLISTPEHSRQLVMTLSVLTTEQRSLRSFCLLRQSMDISDTLSTTLGVFLVSVSGSLEYLQLRRWSFTATDLNTLYQCSKLRVISVTEDCGSSVFNSPKHSVSDILTVISQLPHLEFMHWSENLNLPTAGLLGLYRLLTDSFKSLRHFHIYFTSLLLSTTDLENESYFVLKQNLLVPLLSGLEGSEPFTTFMFVFEKIQDSLSKFLSLQRPDVCFKLSQQVSHAIELHEAVSVYDNLH